MGNVRAVLSTTMMVGLLATAPGCWFTGYEGAFPEGDDVRLELPGQGFRAAGDRGEVYGTIEETARDVNGFVSELVTGVGAVVEALSQYRETSRDGDWRVYGPFDDDEGRDLAWLVKIEGDEAATRYEVWVGAAGSKADAMDRVMNGSIEIDGDLRTGDFGLDFDAIEKHPAIKDPEDVGKTFSGAIEVTFERDVSTEAKTIDIAFIDFREEDLLGDAWFSDETYVYDRDGDGSGSFHLAVHGQADEDAFIGTVVNRLVLDARWSEKGEGRARGMLLEVDNEDSALPYGDLIVHECFEPGGALTYAGVNEAYAQELGHYVTGDASACAFTEADLD